METFERDLLYTSDEVHSFLLEYFQSLKDIRIEMTQFAETKQWDNLKKVVHSLKSSALIVGAQELSSNCESFEELDFDSTTEKKLISSWHEINISIERLTYLLEMELSNNET